MKKEVFNFYLGEGGDCYINYISPISKKPKYHIGTNIFNKDISPYIAKKLKSFNKSPQLDASNKHQLTFCWDLDDFKYIDLDKVLSIHPLNKLI